MSVRVDEGILAAIDEQQSRGLQRSAAWLSELALAATPAFLALPMTPRSSASAPSMTMAEQLRSRQALSLITQQEYIRCARLILGDGPGAAAAGSLHPKLAFFACYALYLAGEKKVTTEQGAARAVADGAQSGNAAAAPAGVVAHGPSFVISTGATATANPHLSEVNDALIDALDAHPSDAYLLWLRGVVLKALGDRNGALTQLLGAVSVEPLLRCAWEDLARLTSGAAQLGQVLGVLGVPPDAPLGDAFMTDIFVASIRSQYVAQTVDVHNEWSQLLEHFPSSAFLRCQLGAALSSRRDFEGCRAQYESVRAADRYRLEGMDDYSNALFVRREKLALGILAEHCYSVDPFRAESNIVAGNYYAIVRRHERSLQHFRRAVAIDPTIVSAWTLMGHEYLEVKNANAAVAAYRNAIAICPSDYRPWYGLGQIYELLQVYHYALHYFWQTTTLRPHDPRMWIAVAGCLERQDRVAEAMACLERAEACDRPNSDQAPQRIRKLLEYFRSVPGGGAKALMYADRLVQCSSATLMDRISNLPVLIESYIVRARTILELPSRSPSFEPNAAASMPRPLSAAKQQECSNALGIAESYLGALMQLGASVDNDETLLESSDADRLRALIAALSADLDVVKSALLK